MLLFDRLCVLFVLYLDRVGRHVAQEGSAVGIIQHGHQSEGIPQQAIQLVDVFRRGWRFAQGEFRLDTSIICENTGTFSIHSLYISILMMDFPLNFSYAHLQLMIDLERVWSNKSNCKKFWSVTSHQ